MHYNRLRIRNNSQEKRNTNARAVRTNDINNAENTGQWLLHTRRRLRTNKHPHTPSRSNNHHSNNTNNDTIDHTPPKIMKSRTKSPSPPRNHHNTDLPLHKRDHGRLNTHDHCCLMAFTASSILLLTSSSSSLPSLPTNEPHAYISMFTTNLVCVIVM